MSSAEVPVKAMTEAVATVDRVEVRHGTFHDPGALMGASARARALPGVEHVALGMGHSPLNLIVISLRHGYDLSELGPVGPNDLVLAVRARDQAACARAMEEIARELDGRAGGRALVEAGPMRFAGDRDGRGPVRMDLAGRPAPQAGALLTRLARRSAQIDRANERAVGRLQEAHPVVVGVGTAGELLPDMTPRTFLHAGPPLAWQEMCGPMRGAVIGAAIYEGLATDPDDAVRRAERGQFDFASGHERGALGPMAGVISPSMPLWVVENAAHGNRAYCLFSEGLGRVLRFGAHDPEVIQQLHWLDAVFAPVMRSVLERLPAPIDLRALNADALQMGDELHNRNRAATSLLLRQLAPTLVEVDDASAADLRDVVAWIAGNDYFYLNLSMAAGKATADAASGIEGSSIVTAMARNGTHFGLRLSGTGARWFCAPAAQIQGCYLPGYGPEDANRDMGDSTITETIGLGAFALAGAPAIIDFCGISAEDALQATLAMYRITWAESTNYRLPALGFRGTPVGIDARRVLETGLAPVFDTGVAHREAGVGTIGGGIVRPPLAPFADALAALAEAS